MTVRLRGTGRGPRREEASRGASPERAEPASRGVPVTIARSAAEALAPIRDDIGDCTRCKLHALGRTQIVFGVGNPNADVMFVGEAPGADEDIQGVPFVGRAGQLLTKMIEAMGFSRDEVYIANVLKCRPPGNRNPEPDEIATCEPFLFRQLASVDPKVVIALGAFAARHITQDRCANLAAAWPGVRFPRRETDPDIPPVVSAPQPRLQTGSMGRSENGTVGPRPSHSRRVSRHFRIGRLSRAIV